MNLCGNVYVIFDDVRMTVEEFNETPQGQILFGNVMALHAEINKILDEVRQATEPEAFGSYVDYDDSGFFDNTDT